MGTGLLVFVQVNGKIKRVRVCWIKYCSRYMNMLFNLLGSDRH